MQVYDVAIETIFLAFCYDCEAHGGHPRHAPQLLLETVETRSMFQRMGWRASHAPQDRKSQAAEERRSEAQHERSSEAHHERSSEAHHERSSGVHHERRSGAQHERRSEAQYEYDA